MFAGVGGGEEKAEIGLIPFVVGFMDVVDVDIGVIAPTVIAIVWLEQRRVVMASTWLVPARKITH